MRERSNSGVRRYRSRTAPSGREAELPTGTGHAFWLLIVAVGTTRDSEPLLPPTVRSRPVDPHAKPRQPPVPGARAAAITAGASVAGCGVSVVDQGRAIRYHARTRSRGGRRFRIAPGQRVLGAMGVSPRGDKSRVQLSPGGDKTTSFCALGRQSAGGCRVAARQIVHGGDIRGRVVVAVARGWRGREITPG